MKNIRSFAITAVVAVAVAIAPTTLVAQKPVPDLDAIVRKVFADQHVVGASVLVMQHDKVLLHKGYGVADLALDVPSKDETVYHIVGPMLPFTGVAVMQLVENGRVGLDDDLSKYVPEFPLQGHHVTIKQLLNHTSGIVDYHYLGDPIEATSRMPKALDEVMALYAGKKWTNDPGVKWDWSISGFQLLVTVVERVSQQRFADYVQKNIFEPAMLEHTSYCDDFTMTKGLSHAYRRFESGYVDAHENDMAYNVDLRFCSSVSDLNKLWSALRSGKLVKPATFAQMQKAEGAALHMSPTDTKAQYGLAMSINSEDEHRRIGQHGSLYGYSGSLYDFPEDGLTITVLSNTEGQNAYAISRALAREILGLSPLPGGGGGGAGNTKALDDVALSAADKAGLDGTYFLKAQRIGADLHDSYQQFVRTYRVFDENGRLMIQVLGEGPERLFKQADGSFARRSAPRTKISFVMEGGKATTMKIESASLPLAGARVGKGDPATFHLAR
ncbi:MAG: serine hydrolase domain-containing protein [Gemmatimonadaceae bacterium]